MSKLDNKLDPRVNAYNENVAAAYLEGKVDAKTYVPAVRYQVRMPVVPLHNKPANASMMETQLLIGSEFDVYDLHGSWLWGQEVQADRKGYVGYVPKMALMPSRYEPTHRISNLRAPAFLKANFKSAIRTSLPMNAKLLAEDEEGDYIRMLDVGYVHKNHVVELGQEPTDFVEAAELHFGLPYIWGGVSPDGVDCSGLVQTALRACGLDAPRDAGMQETTLGTSVEITEKLTGLVRGDLIFWTGHVGIMGDREMLLHANAHHMCVAIEPLRDAAARIAQTTGVITSIKRIL
ncbi:MAG: NlpC/P60 family protein [Robiginitomaculum sp.]